MREIVNQLKKIKSDDVNPDQEWLQKNRELLLSQIKNSSSSRAIKRKFSLDRIWMVMSILLPRAVVYTVIRPVMALFLIFALGTSGWIATVQASNNALPGEWLYPAKRVVEKTRVVAVAAVGDKKSKTKLHLEFAKRRAEETKELVSTKDPEKIEKVSDTLKDLKEEIEKVDEDLKDMGESTDNKATAESVKNVNEKTEEIKVILKEVKADLKSEITSSTKENKLSVNLNANLTEAKDAVNESGVKSMEVLVDKHLNGDDTITKEEVKQIIDTQIKSLAEDADETKKEIEKAEEEINKIEKTDEDRVIKNEENKSEEEKSEEEKSEDKKGVEIGEVAEQTKVASTQAQEVLKSVDKKVTETQKLLFDNDLKSAVRMVLDAQQQGKKMEQVTKEAIKAVYVIATEKTETEIAKQASSTVDVVKTSSTTVDKDFVDVNTSSIKTTTTAINKNNKLINSITQ